MGGIRKRGEGRGGEQERQKNGRKVGRKKLGR
jgi:hypothetical protein